MENAMRKRRMWCFGFIATALVFLVGICNVAQAMELKTDNENIKMRWDNTLKYNLGIRVASPDDALLKSPNYDDGDRNFGRSMGIVTNRLDILSEFDLVYKEKQGFRISASGWYDARYRDPMDNTSLATSNHLTDQGTQDLGLSQRVKNYERGAYGEILDAFVFGSVDIGSVPVNFKLGRHTQYWGESFLGFINAISYGQFPVDIAKALSIPGSEVKELFMPRAALSLQATLSNSVGIQFQQFLQFQPARVPDGGSYMGGLDFFHKGGESLLAGAIFRHESDIEPDGTHDYGFALNWRPEFLDSISGKLGFYYRNFTDQLPQIYLDTTNLQYFFVYPDDIKLYGVSAGFALGGISIGLEYAYRSNQPFNCDLIVVPGTRPGKGETAGTRGDIHTATLNFFQIGGPTALWESSTGILEFTYAHVQRVSDGEAYYQGNDAGHGINKTTRDAMGIAISFTPTWFNVWPAVNLSMPVSFSRGLFGNSALNGGDAEGNGSASIGVSAEVRQKYYFTLSYNTYYGDHDTDASGGISAARGGLNAYLYDRDWVSFTFKTNF